MTTTEALDLAASFQKSAIAAGHEHFRCRVGITSWQDGSKRLFFSSGSQAHSIDLLTSTTARAQAHFAGFLGNLDRDSRCC